MLGSGSCYKARWGRCINFQNQIKILKGPNSFWGLKGLVCGRKILGSTRYGGGRCINFQNQIKILKGPNSFWGLRAG